jgi:hypothetical protein
MEQSELLRHAARCFDKHGIPYFITGAVAAIAYGEPRLTNDIDIVAVNNSRFVGRSYKLVLKAFGASQEGPSL